MLTGAYTRLYDLMNGLLRLAALMCSCMEATALSAAQPLVARRAWTSRVPRITAGQRFYPVPVCAPAGPRSNPEPVWGAGTEQDT